MAGSRSSSVPRRRVRVPGPAERPLRGIADAELDRLWREALERADGAAGAHVVHERWMRGAWPAQIEAALDALWRRAAASVPEWLPMRHVAWLPVAYEVAGRFRAARRGRTHVYLVLLDDSAYRGAHEHGVYVGMSGYAPAVRFDQHKAGIRASGAVLKRGLEPLVGPVLHLQYIARSEAVRIEAGLAAALADAGLRVEGGH